VVLVHLLTLLKVFAVLAEEVAHSTQLPQLVAVAVVLGQLITEQTALAVVLVEALG
jgi:hypothetical protein